jgi:hypothetical protein
MIDDGCQCATRDGESTAANLPRRWGKLAVEIRTVAITEVNCFL